MMERHNPISNLCSPANKLEKHHIFNTHISVHNLWNGIVHTSLRYTYELFMKDLCRYFTVLLVTFMAFWDA